VHDVSTYHLSRNGGDLWRDPAVLAGPVESRLIWKRNQGKFELLYLIVMSIFR
jgi:hypothetical protein